MIFSVYSLSMVFLFPTNMILSYKDEISGIIEKDDVHPRKYSVSSCRKIKDDKKVDFYKKVPMIFCTFMETFMCISYIAFQCKKSKTRKLNI